MRPHTCFAKAGDKGEIMLGTLSGKRETILVVDDDEKVLNVVVQILKRAEFHVLSADNGTAAIALASKTKGRIDLLLSDVDMPLLSGPDLGETLKTTRPDIHVMLMSGGAKGSLLVLNYGWAFIQKPFVPVKLVEMVTDVLHSKNRSQLGGQEFDSRKDVLKDSPRRHSASRS
jgi:two-component system cell cycle sensor histidine kinase/response regulator CckA